MSNRDEINTYVYGLNYNPDELLVFEGTKVTNINPKSGEFDNNKYIVINKEKCTIESDFDVCVTDENRSVAYPGNLILADENLVNGTPTPIALNRAPLNITINLPGMTTDNNITVGDVDYANVSGAMNVILDKWYEDYPEYSTIPSDMSFVGSMVHDKNEMQLRFGCSGSFWENTLGIDFDAISKEEVSVYVAKYKQIFYTASVNPFANPADAFANNVTVSDLKNKKVSDSQPPAYIGTVAYGREIFVKFESSCSKQKLEAALSGKVTIKGVTPGVSGDISVDDESLIIKCSMVVLGGTPMSVSGLYTDEVFINNVNKAIFENVTLSRDNPGYPLGYKAVFLQDNSVAQLHGTSDYVNQTVEEYSNGTLNLEHTGAYVAKFYIYWKEITGYDENGKEIFKDCSWSENGNHKTAKYTTQIALGGNVRNISIKAQGATGLVWDQWHTPIDVINLAMVLKRDVKIWGTTLNQKGSVEPS